MYRPLFLLLALVGATFSLPLSTESFHSVNNRYYVSKITLEYIQAYAHCKVHGLSLATESSSEETTALAEAIKAVGAMSSYFWLGGFYQNGGSFYPEWIWLDSGKPIEYSRWKAPTNPTQSCFVKTPLSVASLSGNWSLTACTSRYNFICKSSI